MIEFILTFMVTFGATRMHLPRRPPPPPVECRVVAYTNSIPPHVIYSPPGCVPAPRTAR